MNFDPNLIEKVVTIIIENAIRFSPDEDKIFINDKILDGYYQLLIKDSGPGLSNDALNNLFEFFVSDELMHHSDGHGLGLALSKIIMGLHNGRINVKNLNNGGVEICLLFQIN